MAGTNWNGGEPRLRHAWVDFRRLVSFPYPTGVRTIHGQKSVLVLPTVGLSSGHSCFPFSDPTVTTCRVTIRFQFVHGLPSTSSCCISSTLSFRLSILNSFSIIKRKKIIRLKWRVINCYGNIIDSSSRTIIQQRVIRSPMVLPELIDIIQVVQYIAAP